MEKIKKLEFVYFMHCFLAKNGKKHILKTYKNQNPLKLDYLEGSFYSLFNFTEKQLTKPLKMNIRNSAVPRNKKNSFLKFFLDFLIATPSSDFFIMSRIWPNFAFFDFEPFLIRSN